MAYMAALFVTPSVFLLALVHHPSSLAATANFCPARESEQPFIATALTTNARKSFTHDAAIIEAAVGVLNETGIAKAMFAARSCLEQHRFQVLMHEMLKAWFSRYFEDDKQQARV
jgi:hypothetical protein